MTKLTWKIRHFTTDWNDITSKVLSVSVNFGREKYLDAYSGGRAILTINNAADYASQITYGQQIEVISGVPGQQFYMTYWVQEVVYNDYPGNTGLNTATITAVDWMSRAGRIYANNLVLSSGGTIYQARLFENTGGGPLPSDMIIYNYGLGDSIASATTYSGSVNNYYNLLNTTERGIFVQRVNTLYFQPRSYIGSLVASPYTIGRTTSTTQIAYQEFQRIQNGTQFINTATIQPSGLTEQTSVNTTSRSTYGAASYSSATVDYTTTQAQGNGDWITNTFSNPSALRFQCSFLDVAQNSTALDGWMADVWLPSENIVDLSYTAPGGSSTTVRCVIEGGNINITPDSTQFTLSFSPLSYYQFFTLNSATLGILDTSRLGW